MNNQSAMNSIEKKAALTLSSVFALRMLGLFMLLPVFAIVGQELTGYTPALIGLAIGAYGLTQAIFQIPFGWLSDRFGRKPIILFGLALFAIGSLVAAFSDHIYGVIAGRLLQGCGAIASAVMALAADLSRDEQRTKIMASIGMSIGAAFALAMIVGPWLTGWLGLQGIFVVIAVLAVVAMFVIKYLTPNPSHTYVQRDAIANSNQFAQVFKDGQLMRLNFGIFTLHFLLTSFFVAFPSQLKSLGVDLAQHSWVYLATMVGAVVLMLPMIIYAEKNRQHAKVMLTGVLLIAAVQFAFGGSTLTLWPVVAAIVVYFTGFNLMEALLPSMISRIAPLSGKGTALGVYSTFQFSGAFLGGPAAGLVLQHFGQAGVYQMGGLMALVWGGLLIGLKNPPAVTSYTLTMPDVSEEAFPGLVAEIKAIEGVSEAVALPEAGAVYLKVDKKQLDPKSLEKYSKR
ncbi:MFS transporter [Aliikangiella marina]|uniref:MFS transporter n=1 Tax=Aliikangiella marina TaxID=1712262 RepID=A0A545T6S3_9GAMM|nr:MFS transporter [Aliikangiella marina]TQV72929.1 MFS transporter [Aliikangiella marina]